MAENILRRNAVYRAGRDPDIRSLPQMKNPYDVLRIKEQDLMRIRKEVDALRVAARLLDAEDSFAAKGNAQPELQRVVEMP